MTDLFRRTPGAIRPLDGESDFDILRALLNCDPTTGRLTWKRRSADWFPIGNTGRDGTAATWNTKFAGKPALTTVLFKGYVGGAILSHTVRAHRAVWAMVHRRWPGQLDHINGDPSDNRITNLREVSNQENCRNKRIPRNNTSGALGVKYRPEGRRWTAVIGVNGRTCHIGSYATRAEAIAARQAAERAHGFHRNHGRSVFKVAQQIRDELGLPPSPALSSRGS